MRGAGVAVCSAYYGGCVLTLRLRRWSGNVVVVAVITKQHARGGSGDGPEVDVINEQQEIRDKKWGVMVP